MNEELFRELAELRQEMQGLNDKLDRLTKLAMEDARNEVIENDRISLEKGLNEVGQALNQMPIYHQPIPQPIYQQQFTPIQPIQKVPTWKERVQSRTENISNPFENIKPKGDLEANIGKNVMGILASLLIFIGIASFVVFVFQDMSEILKCALMWVFSFGLLGLGLWRVEKSKNGFSLSLSGCGIGAVFISLLLSYFYFNLLTSQLLLFGLLVGWSGIVLGLSKRYESNIFVIISYIGFYIALLLGAWSDMVLIGEPVNTIGLMLILHSVFVLFIGSRKIPVSELLYKIFPFVSLFGSFVLILNIGNADYIVWSAFQLESVILTLAMLCQMGALFVYIKNLCVGEVKVTQPLLTAVLLFTIIVNTTGFGVLSSNYYSEVDTEPLFHTLLETEEEKNEQVIYFDYSDDYDYKMYREYEEKGIDVRYAHRNENGKFEIHNENAVSVFLLLSAVCHLVFIEWLRLKEKYPIARNVCLYGLTGLLAIVCSTNMFATIATIMGTVILASALLWYGRNDKSVFKASLIVYFIGLFAGCMESSMSYLDNFFGFYCVFAVLHILYLGFAGMVLKNNYHLSNKAWYYVIGIISLLCITNIFADYISNISADAYRVFYEASLQDKVFIQAPGSYYEQEMYQFLNYDLTWVINFVVLSIIGLFIKLSSFCQNWNNVNGLRKSDGEKLDFVYNLNNGLNCIMLLIGVTLLHDMESIGIVQFFVIMLSSLLCFIGSRELLSRDKRILEYYVGIKATLFINLSMAVFIDSELGYIYSIVCLLIAVASIVIGFRNELKSFRLYGLILSLCSVLKLVMIDISYDNSLGRIFSFIGAGLLCFAIVWIYNKMSEKLKEIE